MGRLYRRGKIKKKKEREKTKSKRKRRQHGLRPKNAKGEKE